MTGQGLSTPAPAAGGLKPVDCPTPQLETQASFEHREVLNKENRQVPVAVLANASLDRHLENSGTLGTSFRPNIEKEWSFLNNNSSAIRAERGEEIVVDHAQTFRKS